MGEDLNIINVYILRLFLILKNIVDSTANKEG